MLKRFFREAILLSLLFASTLFAQDNYFAKHKFKLSGEDLYSALHCEYSEFENSLLYYMRMGNEGHSSKIFEDYFSKVKDEIDFVALDNTSKFLFIRVSYRENPDDLSVFKDIAQGKHFDLLVGGANENMLKLSPADVAYRYPLLVPHYKREDSIGALLFLMIKLSDSEYENLQKIMKERPWPVFVLDLNGRKIAKISPVYEFTYSKSDPQSDLAELQAFFEHAKKNYSNYAKTALELWKKHRAPNDLDQSQLDWFNAAAKEFYKPEE